MLFSDALHHTVAEGVAIFYNGQVDVPHVPRQYSEASYVFSMYDKTPFTPKWKPRRQMVKKERSAAPRFSIGGGEITNEQSDDCKEVVVSAGEKAKLVDIHI